MFGFQMKIEIWQGARMTQIQFIRKIYLWILDQHARTPNYSHIFKTSIHQLMVHPEIVISLQRFLTSILNFFMNCWRSMEPALLHDLGICVNSRDPFALLFTGSHREWRRMDVNSRFQSSADCSVLYQHDYRNATSGFPKYSLHQTKLLLELVVPPALQLTPIPL